MATTEPRSKKPSERKSRFGIEWISKKGNMVKLNREERERRG